METRRYDFLLSGFLILKFFKADGIISHDEI